MEFTEKEESAACVVLEAKPKDHDKLVEMFKDYDKVEEVRLTRDQLLLLHAYVVLGVGRLGEVRKEYGTDRE